MIKSVIESYGLDPYKLQQGFKWTVYILLCVNFFFYLFEDHGNAQHILSEDSSFIAFLRAYATSIDFAAWLVIIALFELETYTIDDEHWTGWLKWSVSIIRPVCYLFVMHTAFAYATSVKLSYEYQELSEINSLCEIADQDESFVKNIAYTTITSENCITLSTGSTFYAYDDDGTITDEDGLQLERMWAWQDLFEVTTWLLIMLLMEVNVKSMGMGVVGKKSIFNLRNIKFLLYACIMGMAVHWGLWGHTLYIWDETLWVFGFLVIEMNLSEWREEILEEAVDAATAT